MKFLSFDNNKFLNKLTIDKGKKENHGDQQQNVHPSKVTR